MGYYLSWSYEQVMSLDHRERLRWVKEVSAINERLNEEAVEKRL